MGKLLFVPLLALAVPAQALDPAGAGYPDGYREWRHIKTMELKPGHALYESFGGIHHLYANPKAVKGYRTGRFADGAVIVFDLLEAETDGHALVEGKRKVLGVMARDARKYTATGGWGFEAFAGGDPKRPVVGANAAKACFECHEAQKGNNYLFSTLRD